MNLSKQSLILFLSLTVAGAFAQGVNLFPTKQIRVVVPITAGSATDTIVRAVAEKMRSNLGQTLLIDNRPGAGTTIGASIVAKSTPDGYTLLANSTAQTANPFLYKNLSYDGVADFVGVTPLASMPNILVVSASSPFKTVSDLVATAKTRPGQLNYASAGTGTGTHLSAEKFRIAANIVAEHIPLKGSPEAITEIISGRLDWYFAPGVTVINLIKEGKLRALAVGSKNRSSLFPGLPTTEEAGIPGSALNFWVALFAPAKTPKDVLEKLNSEANSALQSPEVKAIFSRLGAEPIIQSVADFNKGLEEEFRITQSLVNSANIKSQD
jgi:tripartite-type tricarboxylate transporter receptor subunit TctC